MTFSAFLSALFAIQSSDALCTLQRTELLPVQASPPSPGFGTALGLSGRLAAVGSSGDGVGGTVFLFEQRERGWVQTAALEPSDARDRDFFGSALILEPARLVVTATGSHDRAGIATGSLFIYELEQGTWELQQQLFPDGSGQQEFFGLSLAATDERILVGAPLAQDLGYNSGAAYVFRRDGHTWVQEARLLPDPSAPYGGAFGEFGSAVAMQGETALIGAPNLGLLYCFRSDGQAWRLEQLIEDVPDKGFGAALALEGDTALVGAPMDGFVGVVHAYERGGNGWRRTATIRRANDGSFGTVGFGGYLAIDGGLVAIGSAQIGVYPGFGTWLVERIGGGWTVPQAVVPLGSVPPLVLGHKVALADGRLLVADVPNGPVAGRAFLLDIGRAGLGSITVRQGLGNIPALSARPASVGSTLAFEVIDPPGASPVIFAFDAPAELSFGSGTLLCQDSGSGLLFAATSLVGGPAGTSIWSVSMPPAVELTGFSFCAQAVLLSFMQPLVFTNALDIELGPCVCPDERSRTK